MDWTVWIAPKSNPSDLHRYEVSAQGHYYAQIKAIILYIREVGVTGRTPFQMKRDDLDVKVKCHTDGRLVDYSALGRKVTV